MAKAKKTAKKKAKRSPPTAAPIATQPGRKFTILRQLTLPELTCKLELPVNVTVSEALRPDKKMRVYYLDAGEPRDMVVLEGLAAIFERIYPDGDYVGKSFCIIRHGKHERKNEFAFSVEEIDPTKPVESAP
jgi:hypothetical protein